MKHEKDCPAHRVRPEPPAPAKSAGAFGFPQLLPLKKGTYPVRGRELQCYDGQRWVRGEFLDDGSKHKTPKFKIRAFLPRREFTSTWEALHGGRPVKWL